MLCMVLVGQKYVPCTLDLAWLVLSRLRYLTSPRVAKGLASSFLHLALSSDFDDLKLENFLYRSVKPMQHDTSLQPLNMSPYDLPQYVLRMSCTCITCAVSINLLQKKMCLGAEGDGGGAECLQKAPGRVSPRV